jgi:hypothetical protein
MRKAWPTHTPVESPKSPTTETWNGPTALPAKQIPELVEDSSGPTKSLKTSSDTLFTLQIRKEHVWIFALALVSLFLWMRLSMVSSKLALLETSLALGSK